MVNSELSDLFFNYPKDNYDKAIDAFYNCNGDYDSEAGNEEVASTLVRDGVFHGALVKESVLHQALVKDGAEFITNYPSVMQIFDNPTAEELAYDYEHRV